MKNIIVIGAGAAGLMAGITAANEGANVHLIEKNNIVGKKMGITGKGRCNITNACTIPEFIENTPGNGKFLFSAYNEFSNEALLTMLHNWGLKTKVERGGRVFPESDSAIEVRNLFMKIFKQVGGQLHLSEKVELIVSKEGRVAAVKTNRTTYPADAVIVATGGMSYPVTGSTGDGFIMSKSLGHTITPIVPALVPLETKEGWVKSAMGLSLKNVTITLYLNGKKSSHLFGEMMFTHFGITGPMVLSISRTVSKALYGKKQRAVTVAIDLKPALHIDQLDRRIQRDFQENKNKQMGNVLRSLVPAKLIPVILDLCELTESRVVNSITKEERLTLGKVIKNLPLTITKPRPIDEAIVTCGGISVKEVSPKTMESKVVQGLYFAGEVLDVDALTGGYNLQAAFSMGYVAGKHAAKEDL